MGLPLGPALADIINYKLDNAIQETEIYARYVDDTLLICKNEAQASELLDAFNSVLPNIKFFVRMNWVKQFKKLIGMIFTFTKYEGIINVLDVNISIFDGLIQLILNMWQKYICHNRT